MPNPDFYKIQGTECIDYDSYTIAFFRTLSAAEEWIEENKDKDEYLYHQFDIRGCYFHD